MAASRDKNKIHYTASGSAFAANQVGIFVANPGANVIEPGKYTVTLNGREIEVESLHRYIRITPKKRSSSGEIPIKYVQVGSALDSGTYGVVSEVNTTVQVLNHREVIFKTKEFHKKRIIKEFVDGDAEMVICDYQDSQNRICRTEKTAAREYAMLAVIPSYFHAKPPVTYAVPVLGPALPPAADGHTSSVKRVCIISKKFPGTTLAKVLEEAEKTNRPIPFYVKLIILQKMIEKLEYLHANGLIHRDIKPENIMISGDLYAVNPNKHNIEVNIIDVGLSKRSPVNPPEILECTRGSIVGTPHYMSPECSDGADVDAPVDVFALGRAGWELMTQLNIMVTSLGAGMDLVELKKRWYARMMPAFEELSTNVFQDDMASAKKVYAMFQGMNEELSLRYTAATCSVVMEQIITEYEVQHSIQVPKPPVTETQSRFGFRKYAKSVFALFGSRDQSPARAAATPVSHLSGLSK